MCIRCICRLKTRSFPGLRGSLCSPEWWESRKKEQNASRKMKGWLDSRQCVCVSGMQNVHRLRTRFSSFLQNSRMTLRLKFCTCGFILFMFFINIIREIINHQRLPKWQIIQWFSWKSLAHLEKVNLAVQGHVTLLCLYNECLWMEAATDLGLSTNTYKLNISLQHSFFPVFEDLHLPAG